MMSLSNQSTIALVTVFVVTLLVAVDASGELRGRNLDEEESSGILAKTIDLGSILLSALTDVIRDFFIDFVSVR